MFYSTTLITQVVYGFFLISVPVFSINFLAISDQQLIRKGKVLQVKRLTSSFATNLLCEFGWGLRFLLFTRRVLLSLAKRVERVSSVICELQRHCLSRADGWGRLPGASRSIPALGCNGGTLGPALRVLAAHQPKMSKRHAWVGRHPVWYLGRRK